MNNLTKDIFGYIGALLLSITLLPQIHQTYKTKQTRDISLVFMCLQILTCVFFLIYGIALSELPLIIANSVVLFQLFILLYAKLYFDNGDKNIRSGISTI